MSTLQRGAPITPAVLTEAVLERLPGALLAFDVDGVLAPLVAHLDDSALADGVAEALGALARHAEVALLSGRSLTSLARLLEFPPGLHVIGSHGLEVHGVTGVHLDPAEQDTYEVLAGLARRTVAECGAGAWVEYKPASVVLHTRQAAQSGLDDAIDALVAAANDVGALVKSGHHVVELMVRTGDKGSALLRLADEVGASSLVFLGDDRTDEDAFARMGPDDLSVRVGPGDTVARFRLPDSAAAAGFVIALARQIEG